MGRLVERLSACFVLWARVILISLKVISESLMNIFQTKEFDLVYSRIEDIEADVSLRIMSRHTHQT
jgi:hypothetical protein